MQHPVILMDLARSRMADDLRQAERDRRAKEAASARSERPIDAVPFHDRLVRLFGTVRSVAGTGPAARA